MSSIYDYPGGYRLRFDGIAPSEWCGYFASWNYSQGSQPLKIQKLKVADPRGVAVLDSWHAATSPAGGPPKALLIEGLNQAKVPVARWKVRNGRPTKWLGRTASKNEITIETLEIVHEGIVLVR